jgi:hypothetical protein
VILAGTGSWIDYLRLPWALISGRKLAALELQLNIEIVRLAMLS